MKPDIYSMTVSQLKAEERYVRNRLKEVRRLIKKRTRSWLPPEKKVVIP